ncbi:helix-turn-helix domain-containing protein [Saccharopolyspora sp. CA-218241]|uniref:helix-turn-helix domain-containing protein n=1 Tax=Saccharopolyspora sp. CA-218241 TaxID=3240027 RepID=UPI003D987C9F
MTDGAPRVTIAHRAAFGDCVRSLRQACDLSQEQLADAAGMHRTYVSSLERGQRNVGLDNIMALAQALGVSPARLFDFCQSE